MTFRARRYETMTFRVRCYEEDEAHASLPRQPSHHHPLIANTPEITPVEQRYDDELPESPRGYTISDPLGVNFVRDPLFSPPVTVTIKTSQHATSIQKLDEQAEINAGDWEIHRASILQKFASSDTIKVSSDLGIISKHVKGRGRSIKTAEMGKQNDLNEGVNEDIEVISQEECVTRLRELNDDIARAWRNNDRVGALRLAVKVAKLLSDTSVPNFYPTMFILVTDVMESFGLLVWKRLKGKAELDDNGRLIKLLPSNFSSEDVCHEAKDTCNNWFFKIGSIHELLPRIYLEIAILHCLRFLENEPPQSALQRLMLMIRGITDPLVAAYARIYLARKGQSIIPHETGYLIMGLDDYLLLFQKVISGEFEKHTSRNQLDRKSHARLMEPMFELYMHYICQNATKEELLFILRTFCEQQSGLCVTAAGAPPVSVVVHYLIKEIPAIVVGSKVTDFSRIIKHANDVSKPQYMNYRLLGEKVCECNPPREIRLVILNDIWKVVSKFSDLVEYLLVADVISDFILQFCSVMELHVLLRDIKQHLVKAKITDEALWILETIILKIVTKIADLKNILDLPYFVDILDQFFGDVLISIHKKILQHVSRMNNCIVDPVTRHFVFELCKSLYKSLDHISSDDEQRQGDRLISRFVQLVDFGHDVEQHLLFLVECRGKFSNCDYMRECIVHTSSRIAVTKMKLSKSMLTQQSIDFIKACLTFSELTIPSIRSYLKRAHLYLETAEVALMNGLVSRSESLLKNSIICLEEYKNEEDTGMEKQLCGCIQKICSLLVVLPGDQDRGVCYLFDRIVQLTQVLLKGTLRVQAIVGVILACHAISQENLPYHVSSPEVISNDELFCGQSSYIGALQNFVMGLLDHLTLSSGGTRDQDSDIIIVDALLVAFEFKDNDQIYDACKELLQSLKGSQLKYGKLNSLINKFETG